MFVNSIYTLLHKKITLLPFVLLLCLPAVAQIPYSVHYTVRDGLPSNKVYCASEDSKGFVWLGTDNGLVRFNGSEFKTFSTEEGLPDNEVLSVGEDNYDRLWIFCFKQAPCYFYKNKLYTSKNDSFLAKYFNNPGIIRYVYEPSIKRMLFYIELNGKVAVIENFKITTLPFETPKDHSGLPVINFFNDGQTDCFFERDKLFIINSNQKGNGANFAYSTFIWLNKKLFGLGIDQNNHQYNFFNLSNNSINIVKSINNLGYSNVFSNKAGVNLLLNDSGYLCHINPISLEIEKERAKIESGRFSTGLVDLQGNRWICTHDNGLFVFPKHAAEFLDTKTDKGAGCLSMNPSNGDIAFGFENKVLHVFDKELKSTRMKLPVSNLNQTRITKMVFIKDKLYAGGDFLLQEINLGTKKTHEMDPKQGSMLLNIKDMEPSDSNGFLIGSTHGAGYFSAVENRISEVVWKTRTVAVAKDVAGSWYLGTINGLFMRKTGKTEVTKLVTKTALDEARITDIKIDNIGKVWITTAQAGLFIMDHSSIFNITSGSSPGFCLSNNQTKNVFFDDNGAAWVSTMKGLNKVTFNTQTNQYRVQIIHLPFGLPDENINDCIVKGNEVYVATLSGAFRFMYQNNSETSKPRIVFTDLASNNIPFDFVNDGKPEFSESTITIGFTPILYTRPDNIVYSYRLVGYNSDWLSTKNNKIDFLNLSGGKYRFEVKVTNTLTGETSEVKTLEFTIKTPWYKQWWFILLLAVSLIYILYWLVRKRIESIRSKAQINNSLTKQVVEMEMQALRAHMNPHFIFNALSAIQNYYSNNEEEKANEYMFKFSGLIRKMLDYSKDNFIPLDEEIDLVRTYMTLEQMRFEDLLEFKFNIDEDLDPTLYKLPSLMLQPLLENAVNHGVRTVKGQGLIELNISKNQTGIRCEVKDNGIGIIISNELKKSAGSNHKSKGLAMLLKRIESINQLYGSIVTIKIEDVSEKEPGKTGTCITLDFPFNITEVNL